jgi:hypothetical protein
MKVSGVAREGGTGLMKENGRVQKDNTYARIRTGNEVKKDEICNEKK